MIFSLTVNSTNISLNDIISNGNLATLSVASTCTLVNINGNNGRFLWTFEAFNSGTFSNNRLVEGAGGGNLTFGSTFSNSSMTGNNIQNGGLIINGAVSFSNISANSFHTLSLNLTVSETVISSNQLNSNNPLSLSISGNCTRVKISGNNGRNSWDIATANTFSISTFCDNTLVQGPGGGILTFGTVTDSTVNNNVVISGRIIFNAAVTDSTICSNRTSFFSFLANCSNTAITSNRLSTSATVTTTFVNSVFGDNAVGTFLAIDGVATRSTIKGNVIGTSISIDALNTGISTNNSITGNTCGTTMFIGAAAAGMLGNIINANVVPTSITVVSGLVRNNIATSNRSAAIVGFMGTDVVANNV
jgi:hypothetical protein